MRPSGSTTPLLRSTAPRCVSSGAACTCLRRACSARPPRTCSWVHARRCVSVVCLLWVGPSCVAEARVGGAAQWDGRMKFRGLCMMGSLTGTSFLCSTVAKHRRSAAWCFSLHCLLSTTQGSFLVPHGASSCSSCSKQTSLVPRSQPAGSLWSVLHGFVNKAAAIHRNKPTTCVWSAPPVGADASCLAGAQDPLSVQRCRRSQVMRRASACLQTARA